MWDMVPDEEGAERLENLCGNAPWREMISKGARIARISNINPDAKAYAEHIVSEILSGAPPVILGIQDEMINQGRAVAETSAGMIVTQNLLEARLEVQKEMQEMRESVRKGEEVNEGLMKELRQKEAALEKEVERFNEPRPPYQFDPGAAAAVGVAGGAVTAVALAPLLCCCVVC